MLAGDVGDYAVFARKERGKPTWFMGGITDEEGRDLDLPLSFLDAGARYRAEIYRDGDGADFRTNPRAIAIEKRNVTAADRMKLRMAPGGGFAIRLVKTGAMTRFLLAPSPRCSFAFAVAGHRAGALRRVRPAGRYRPGPCHRLATARLRQGNEAALSGALHARRAERFLPQALELQQGVGSRQGRAATDRRPQGRALHDRRGRSPGRDALSALLPDQGGRWRVRRRDRSLCQGQAWRRRVSDLPRRHAQASDRQAIIAPARSRNIPRWREAAWAASSAFMRWANGPTCSARPRQSPPTRR